MLSILSLSIFAVLVHGEALLPLHKKQTLMVSSAPDQNEAGASWQTTSMVNSLSDRSVTDTMTPDLVNNTTSTTSGDTTPATLTTSLLQDVAKTDVNITFSRDMISPNQSLSVTTKENKQEDNGQTHSHSGTSTKEAGSGPVTESCIGKGCTYRLTERIPIPQTEGGSTFSSLLTTPTSPVLEKRQSVVPSAEEKTTSVKKTTTAAPLVSSGHQVPTSSSSIGSSVGNHETTTSISSDVERVGQVSGDVSMPTSSSSIGSSVRGYEPTKLMSLKTDDSKHKHGATSTDANMKDAAVSERNEMSKTFEHPQSGFPYLSLTDLSILGVSVGFAVAVLVVVIVVVLKRQGEPGEKKMISLNKEISRVEMRALRRNTINDVKASLVGIPSNGDIWLEMNRDSSIVV
ncbi:uncharacterized protein [Haliotis asinina]|uniref:uncharacterized protein n=1 Tax=Haliotis asinina TaxID=109174 RepID=UPI0035327183